MSEQPAAPAASAEPEPQAPQTPPEGGEQEPRTFDADYVANLRKEAAKYRTEARTHAAELEKVRQSSMSEAEKAVAEAEARGRTAAVTEFGQELARERFDALAGRRNRDFDTAKALEYVDLSKFIGEDGRPDAKVIQAAVERLVPESATPTPSFDGGTRTPPPIGVDMNTALRRATGRT